MEKIDTRQFTFRIQPDLHDKVIEWAKREHRATNSQIVVVLERAVAEYEREHGPILVENEVFNS